MSKNKYHQVATTSPYLTLAAHPKFAKNQEKEGEIGEKRENREEKAKIGKGLLLCPVLLLAPPDR